MLLRMRPRPCRRAPSRGAEGAGEPACGVEGAPGEARVCSEGPVERSYHPSSSPSPTHSGSARVEEGMHPFEGGARGWSDSVETSVVCSSGWP